MSFSAALSKAGIRQVSRTLHCLSRIGGELTLEATGSQLLLRTLAPSHAAYALVALDHALFDPGSFYNADASGAPLSSQGSAASGGGSGGSGYVKCKLLLKQLLLPFRHAAHLERMEWLMSGAENAVKITTWAGGITSHYRIPFENLHNILQADFPRSQSPNVLQLKPLLLLQSLEHFSPKLSEVTLLLHWPDVAAGAAPDDAVIKLKSFDPSMQQQAGMHTGGQQLIEMPMHPGECELTFNVREVRAFLSFCEGLNGFDCKVSFGGIGQPMLLETIQRHGFQRDGMGGGDELQPPLVKMDLVVATLAEAQSQSQSATSTPQQAAHVHAQQRAQAPHAHQQAYQQPPLPSSQGHAAAAVATVAVAGVVASQTDRDPTLSQAFLQKQSAVILAGEGDYGEGEYVPPTP